MFREIARFELRHQLRSPVFAIGFVLFLLLAFGATTMDEIQIGARGNVNVNSPFAILQTLGIMSVFGIFVVTAFVAGAVIRDDETGFAPIVRATRVAKPAYVFGRFAGALAVAFVVISAVALGIALGAAMPWLDATRVGPWRTAHYAYGLFVFALPTLLVVSAAFFALATATRSLTWTYVGAVLALVLFVITRALLRDPAYDVPGALADPFGVAALNVATKYWTASERNTLLPPLAGVLLANRLLWLGISAALLALAYAIFRMDGRALVRRAQRRTHRDADDAAAGAAAATAVPAAAHAGAALRPGPRRVRWSQFRAVMRFEARSVFRSPAFFVLMAIGVLNAWGGLWFASRLYGTEVWPVTRIMVQALQGSFSIVPVLIAIWYAGELVWRDRTQRMHEIVDATAAPNWVHLLPKVAAIAGVLVAANLVGVATGIAVQTVRGYHGYEIGRYLLWFVWPQSVTAVLIAAFAVFVQTLVAHKATGWAVMLLYTVAAVALAAIGWEHNLYQYAGTPPVPLSDMNGQGHFWIGAAWFQAYWAAFAVMLVVAAQLLRRRGAEVRLRPRLQHALRSLRGAPGVVFGTAALAWAGTGAWIFHNTNVVNDYVTRPETDALLARYERTLLAYEKTPQPRISDVVLDVQLHPRDRRAVTAGSYRVENRTGAPLAHVHLRWLRPLQLRELNVPGAVLEKDHGELNYRIYRFEPALAPGEQRSITFRTELSSPGFTNGAQEQRLVDNGTFLSNLEIAPLIGMNRFALLDDRAKRRRHGLPPELRMAALEDEAARANHYLRNDSDWVHAKITLTTDADQTPVAPGATLGDTRANGRRTLVTQTEAPIQHFFSLQSARYEVARRSHGATRLAVYHQRGHEANVQRMLDAMARSIDVFGAEFGPYQFREARIVEFPAYATFAQAFAGTIPYSEGIGFLMRHRDEEAIDMVTYVTAHEIAHQWWAHQVIGADAQGSTMLSETFAQYGALLVMERMFGREQIRRFLKYELDRYLRSRGGEPIEELPLARVENQPYIHYQKGALAMYWLKEVVGEAVVNRALRRLIERYAFKGAPYPTSRDFLRLLREQAGPAHEALIADLFERIVLVDVKVTKAATAKRADGRWDVTLEVRARKLVADGRGVENEAPLDEPFEIGIFTAEPGRKGFGAASVLLLERRALRSGAQTLRFTVDREPKVAGVDPYNKRIDRNSDDNLADVER